MSNIHLIANAHLDPVWLWRWQDGFSEILATYRSVLDRMKEFPDLKFTSACAVYYEWIEKVDPDMFGEIQKMAECGRWEIVGGWFLQPDCNIPDGESYARHALISQSYFKEKFGITAKTGYNVDSFGHNASLPKILSASGMENYVFMRPSVIEQKNDNRIFMWQSDDGSKVCAYRIPYLYGMDVPTLGYLDKIKALSDEQSKPFMAFIGIGNHGGGPSIELLDKLHTEHPDCKYSTTKEYFASLDKENLPTLCGELQHHARGCYSTESDFKKRHRKCEQNLLTAEKLCVMAKELTGSKYPAKKLNKAWKNLLFTEFHDIMGGCSIKPAFEDAKMLLGEIMSITEQEINFAMQKIAWSIDTLQGEKLPSYRCVPPKENWTLWKHEVLGTPIVVFNPSCHTVRQLVSVYASAKKVTDCDGAEIPFQMVRSYQTNWDDKYYTAFIAEVPAYGYAVYRIFTEKPSEKEFDTVLSATENSLENDVIKVVFDEKSGDICSFYNKKTNEYIINKPCRAILLDETACDTWAHDKVCLGDEVSEFGNAVLTVTECGKVRASLMSKVTCGSSIITRTFSIIPGSDEITVKTVADFHEKHRTLKLTFPLTDETVTAKIPYGTIKRTGYTGEEPCGSWISSGRLCVANDSKHAYDTLDGELRLTVLRSAIYADHYGKRDEFCEFMEQGLHEFCYSLFPFTDAAGAEKRASELNSGLRVICGSFHDGALPEKFSAFECDNQNISVSAIKERESGDGNLIRFYEANGKESNVSFKLFGKEFSCVAKANGLYTLDENGNQINLIENI